MSKMFLTERHIATLPPEDFVLFVDAGVVSEPPPPPCARPGIVLDAGREVPGVFGEGRVKKWLFDQAQACAQHIPLSVAICWAFCNGLFFFFEIQNVRLQPQVGYPPTASVTLHPPSSITLQLSNYRPSPSTFNHFASCVGDSPFPAIVLHFCSTRNTSTHFTPRVSGSSLFAPFCSFFFFFHPIFPEELFLGRRPETGADFRLPFHITCPRLSQPQR